MFRKIYIFNQEAVKVCEPQISDSIVITRTGILTEDLPCLLEFSKRSQGESAPRGGLAAFPQAMVLCQAMKALRSL